MDSEALTVLTIIFTFTCCKFLVVMSDGVNVLELLYSMKVNS